MPSTYTLNNGIELIGTGEQSGTWGDTTNTNFELLDTALDGQVSVTLAATGSSGSPNTLPISDGASSNGRNRLVTFGDGGDLGGTAFVQLTPNDAEKIIYVRNNLSGSRSILLFQGTYNASNDYEVPAGTTAVVFFNGAGTGAVAANVFNNAYFDSLRLGGVSVTAIIDDDSMGTASDTNIATSESIKAYVDAQVGANNELSEVLANGNTTGGTDIAVSTGDDITFADSSKAIFGAGSDLQIFSDGTKSYLIESGSGDLELRATDFVVKNAGNTKIMASFNDGGTVQLRYDNAVKLATSSTGIDVTGNATFADNGKAIFGAGSDLSIFHNGSSSLIEDSGTGGLTIRSNLLTVQNAAGNETVAQFVEDGFVKLFHNNSQVFTTVSTGVDVTGTVTADGLTVETDNASIVFTGTTGNNFITAKQGLRIDIDSDNNQGATSFGVTRDGGLGNVLNANENGDVTLYASDGTTAKFFWDASSEFLGLGTSTPRTGLHLYGAGQTTSAISDAGSLGAFLRVSDTGTVGGSGGGVIFGSNQSEADGFAGFAAIKGLLSNGNDRTIGALAFSTRAANADTALTERMRLTSDGKLGIGTSSPARTLEVYSSAPAIKLNNGTNAFTIGTGAFVDGSNSLVFFDEGVGERMRLDASGNLLVGTTSTSISNEGAVIFPSGVMTITNDGGRPLRLNRKTSDGDIVQFDKNGASVGSVGVYESDRLYIADQSNGLQFDQTIIRPCNNTGANTDNVVDLGSSGSRFKDLYLSGVARVEGARIGPSSLQTTTITGLNADASKCITGDPSGGEFVAYRIDNAIAFGDFVGAYLFGNDDNTATEDHFCGMWAKGAATSGTMDMFFAAGNTGYETDTPQMTLKSSGYLGVGTDVPSSNLHVQARTSSENCGLRVISGTSNVSYINLGDTADNNICSIEHDNSTNQLKIYTNNGVAMAIDVSKLVSINNTNTVAVGYTHRLFVNDTRTGSTSATMGLKFASTATRRQINFINPNGIVGRIQTSGTATSYVTSSDYRLKENVVDITDGIERVKQLSPKRFNFIADADLTVDGFIAHETQTVVPEAIDGVKDETHAVGNVIDAAGEIVETGIAEPEDLQEGHTWTATGSEPVYQGIDQSKIVPVLTAALKEAIAKIEALETRLTALEG